MRAILPYLNLFMDVATFYGRPEPITILEIGVARGMSTRYFLMGLGKRYRKGGSGMLYSIDIEKCSGIVTGWCKKVNPELLKYWYFILGDSKTVPWDKKVDVLFIDGGHGYQTVKADFEKYVPFVKEGGLILMHDVTYPRYGVKDFWKEIKYPKAILSINKPGLGVVNKI